MVRCARVATAALVLLPGCASGSTESGATPELREHYRHLERLVEARDRARAVLQERDADLAEGYAEQDSIFAIEYPDGPRPLIQPFVESVAYFEARRVVDSLDREIASLEGHIEALRAVELPR